MEAYTGFAKVYDLFMDNIPYEEWSRRIVGILKQYGISDGLVLDLGCGTGSMTELLANAGYDMIGLDASEEMLNLAVQKRAESGLDILYLLQDMRELELYGTVRAVVSVCDSINYVTEEADLLQVFRLVNNYLDPGGIFLFDLNTVAENRREGSFIWENYFDAGEGLNEYSLTLFIREEGGLYRKYEETHYQRAYSLERVRELLEEAGLEVLGFFDAETGLAPEKTAERIYAAAREQGKRSV